MTDPTFCLSCEEPIGPDNAVATCLSCETDGCDKCVPRSAGFCWRCDDKAAASADEGRLNQEVEQLKAMNATLLTACRAALLVIQETHVYGCRIELTLKAAIAKATGGAL